MATSRPAAVEVSDDLVSTVRVVPEETGLPLPKEPTLFLKATSALCGPTDDLIIPRGAKSVDWEVELVVVPFRHDDNGNEVVTFAFRPVQ